FIKKQSIYNMQNNNLTKLLKNANSNLMKLSKNTNSIYNITDPLQHKERGQPANKRHLSAIKN
ncbi:5480_t:CDS:1, partial [Gigaspora margarita]